MDVKTPFLNGVIGAEVYIEQPESPMWNIQDL